MKTHCQYCRLHIHNENLRNNWLKWPTLSPCSMISTRFFKCGRIAHPMRMAICCTILIPVCLACQDFLLLHTAFKNGSSDGIPRAEATTAKALAVVLRTYSSMLSMSGLIVEIIVARPAACNKDSSFIDSTNQIDKSYMHQKTLGVHLYR